MINDFYNRNFPVIEFGEGYILREQSPTDAKDFLEYYSDPQVSQYILATQPKNLTDAESEINYCRNLFYYRNGLYWTIARKQDNCMIGAIGLYINNQHHRAEICYDLSRQYWRQGIMRQAIQCVLDYAFANINIFRVEALTIKENIPSINILKKMGFHHEATLQNYRYFQNRSHTVEMFAITRDAYLNRSSQNKTRKDYNSPQHVTHSSSIQEITMQ